MKELKMRRRLFSLLMAVILCFTMMPTMAFADDETDNEENAAEEAQTQDANKILTVDQNGYGDYTTIQKAINAIYEEDDSTDWMITVNSGNYPRFTVLEGMTGLTIQAADNAEVVVSTWDGTESESGSVPKRQESYYLYNGIYIMSQNVTLEGLTIKVGWDVDVSYATTLRTGLSDFDLPNSSCWYVAGIRTTKADSADGLVIDNCHFTSSHQGNDTDTNYGILTACHTFTVKNSDFSDLWQGISVMGDYYAVEDVSIEENIFTNCNRAISIYYKVAPEGDYGSLSITNNEIIGSDDIRSKIILHDVSSNGSMGNVTLSNNTFDYGFVIIVNFAESSDTINEEIVANGKAKAAVLTDNIWENGSFYVESSEYYNSETGYTGTISADYPELAYYESPEDDEGYWVLNANLDSSPYTGTYENPSGTTTYVQSVINEANRNKSHTLSFTFNDENELIWTLTAFKDAIYWVTGENGKASYPGLEKKILVTDENGVTSEKDYTSVSAGDDVKFQLTSNVPTDLTNYLKADDASDPESDKDSVVSDKSGISLMSLDDLDGYDNEVNGGSYILTFHDEMDSALTFNEESVTVTLVIYEQDENGDPVYEEDGVTRRTKEVVLDINEDDYKILTGTDIEDECTFEVTMDLVALYEAEYFTEDDFGNVEIVVTYTATATDTISAGDHLNTSAVEYEGNSTEKDTVVVYTYGVRIFKFDQSSEDYELVDVTDSMTIDDGIITITIDGEDYVVAVSEEDDSMSIIINGNTYPVYTEEDDEGNITTVSYANVTAGVYTGLADAEFALYREATSEEIEDTSITTTEIKITVAGEDGETTERTITCVTVATLTSNENGYAVYQGLAAGTYYLVETKAPSGYVKSDTPLTVTILEGKKDEGKYILNTSFANSPIPSTGGAGTRMYLIGGVCIMLAAGVMLILSRRRKDFEQ